MLRNIVSIPSRETSITLVCMNDLITKKTVFVSWQIVATGTRIKTSYTTELETESRNTTASNQWTSTTVSNISFWKFNLKLSIIWCTWNKLHAGVGMVEGTHQDWLTLTQMIRQSHEKHAITTTPAEHHPSMKMIWHYRWMLVSRDYTLHTDNKC